MDSYNDNLHKKSTPVLYEYAKQMRENATKAEEILWQRLRNKQINGLKFRRQHPIDKFITDFYCHEKKLVIELDGNIHKQDEQSDLDKGRTETLNEFGINVLRFNNEEILNDIKNVILQIIKTTVES
ncbi:MAG: endonuclease domain-containing protein [Chitinophagales bacterium]